jgi:hypothetical protein
MAGDRVVNPFLIVVAIGGEGSKRISNLVDNWLRVLAGIIGGSYNGVEMMRERSAICRMSL